MTLQVRENYDLVITSFLPLSIHLILTALDGYNLLQPTTYMYTTYNASSKLLSFIHTSLYIYTLIHSHTQIYTSFVCKLIFNTDNFFFFVLIKIFTGLFWLHTSTENGLFHTGP